MEKEKLIETYKEIISFTEKSELKGKNMLYTSNNGYMYSMINKNNELGFRLSKADRAEFDKKYGVLPFMSHGATMRDYVLIPESLLSDIKVLAAWLSRAHEHVSTLKPK